MRGLPQSSFPTLPDGWNQERVANAIEGIEPKPGVLIKRDGDYILLDHDDKRQKIMAYAPFFWIYGSIPEGQVPSSAQYRDIEIKILHEVAHFWVGGDEAKADDFSNTITQALDNNILFCQIHGPTSPQDPNVTYAGVLYSLASNRGGLFSQSDLFHPGEQLQAVAFDSEHDPSKNRIQKTDSSIVIEHLKDDLNTTAWTVRVDLESHHTVLDYRGQTYGGTCFTLPK